MLQKSWAYGFSGAILSWFRSYRRVPQGSILGPILVSLFITDTGSSLRSNFVLFADDMKIDRAIRSEKDIDDLRMDLNFFLIGVP